MRITFLFMTLGLITTGCGATTSSKNIRTAGVVALVDVVSEGGDEATVTAELVVGGAGSNTSLVLEGGDRMFVERGSERKELRAVGGEEYEARFSDGGSDFLFSFERDGDDAAPRTTGTLPAPFEITSDLGGSPISRAKDGVEITWEPSGEKAEVEIRLDGDCIHDMDIDVAGDPGKHTIPQGELRAWKSKKDEACDVSVVVTRTAYGKPDPALDADSRMRLTQVRQTSFVSGP